MKALLASGKPLGAFASAIGELSRVLVLREFASADALADARLQMLIAENPLGVGEWLVKLQSESYALFPFLAAEQTGPVGKWYELRTYSIRQGVLAQTNETWREAVPPRTKLSPMIGAFTALDGEQPRFLNIWAYRSAADRTAIRADAVKQGVWPPTGRPANLTKMVSTLCAPVPFSSLK